MLGVLWVSVNPNGGSNDNVIPATGSANRRIYPKREKSGAAATYQVSISSNVLLVGRKYFADKNNSGLHRTSPRTPMGQLGSVRYDHENSNQPKRVDECVDQVKRHRVCGL